VAGLHRLLGFDDQGRARFDRVSVRHGVVGKPFGANLEADAKGRIWSQQFVFDPAEDRLDELEPGAGNFFGTPWFRSHTQTSDGRLFFGGSSGILVLKPAAYPPPPPPPPLAITRLRINGLAQQVGASGAPLRLPAGTQSFGVEFAGLALGDAQRLRYRHRLLGLEQDWVPGDASFRAPSYSHLAPGRYKLQVQVTSSGGADERWSEPLELEVELAAAWWQWRWLQGLALLLVVALLVGLMRWRERQQRHRASELERLVAERTAALRDASLTDPLTGLRNRRYLAQRIEADLAAARAGDDLLLFLIDLDHFKRINDVHGHGPGDEVLFAVAQRLREVFADDDVVTRWGGEEFLVVVPKRARADAPLLARLLLGAVRDGPVHVGGGRLVRLSTSVGWVAYPPLREQPEAWSWAETLDLADAALFDAKARGRDRAVGLLDSAGLTPAQLGPQPGRWLLDARLKPRVDS
jgi:diguanylate cyclase (GGDEF)-like protein